MQSGCKLMHKATNRTVKDEKYLATERKNVIMKNTPRNYVSDLLPKSLLLH
jgi:hypothetical protein